MAVDLLLRNVEVANFKSIEHADLGLRQLTVVVGANSAGKTSLIQTIFLLAQVARETSRPGLISLNGTELSLGNFRDVVHGGEPERRIQIGVTASSRIDGRRRSPYLPPSDLKGGGEQDPISQASWAVTLVEPKSEALGMAGVAEISVDDRRSGIRLQVSPNNEDERAEVARLYQRSRRLGLLRPTPVPRGRMVSDVDRAIHFRAIVSPSPDAGPELPGAEELLPAVTVDSAFPVDLYGLGSETFQLALKWIELASMGAGADYRRLWSRSRLQAREFERDAETAVAELAQAADSLFPMFARWVHVTDRDEDAPLPRADVADLPRDVVEPMIRYAEPLAREFANRLESSRSDNGVLLPHPSAAVEVAGELSALFRGSVHYLGPLREDPSPSYRPGQSGGVATLGVKGQYTVAALHSFRERLTVCPMGNREARTLPLGEAVNHWAEKFGIAGKVETFDKGRPGLELALTDIQTRAKRDPTSVGVGASQLLPVIVICLLAQPGELILLEQPELHLHPAPQQVLGDFLVGIAESGRQLVVETHSEYLINRLRLHVAEDEYNNVRDLVQIWYAERSDGKTRFRSLQANSYGSFEEWPAGFFDQAPRDSEQLLRAAAAKRARSGN